MQGWKIQCSTFVLQHFFKSNNKNHNIKTLNNVIIFSFKTYLHCLFGTFNKTLSQFLPCTFNVCTERMVEACCVPHSQEQIYKYCHFDKHFSRFRTRFVTWNSVSITFTNIPFSIFRFRFYVSWFITTSLDRRSIQIGRNAFRVCRTPYF